MHTPLRVGLIGFGTVGGGVARILVEHAERTALRAGRPIEIRQVAVRDLNKPREIDIPGALLTDDPLSVARNPDLDVIIELIGGLSPAKELVTAALESGKDVVTANKALLCEHGDELFRRARERGRSISFEAAVAGGCPVIAALGQAMTGNQILAIEAILNGTSNFILTQMFHENVPYEAAVRQAQQCGYAEADPSMDVKGTDAAQKLGILVRLAYGCRATLEQFPVQGIDELALMDLKFADELGYAVKLLATAKLVDGHLELHTQPTLIRHHRPLAQVDGPYNMIELRGDAVGKVWLSAMGAGQMATASAVVADLVDVAAGRARINFERLNLAIDDPPPGGAPLPRLQRIEDIQRRYYFRFLVEDRPHVIADIADILGRNGISLASVIQKEVGEPDEAGSDGAAVLSEELIETLDKNGIEPADGVPIVPLVFMTHRTTEGNVRAAAVELDQLTCVRPPWLCLPVSD
jgi:homoserine dehydrogenase